MKTVHQFILLLTLASTPLLATDYYVSPAGDDSHPGTLANPLRTIQAGIAKLNPGDELHVLPGVYRESVNVFKSGAPGNPVRITAEPGSVLLDGTEEIDAVWEHHSGEIYKATVPGPVEQLFFNDTMLVEARWPNMKFPDQLYSRSAWATSDNGSSLGTLKDAALAATGIDWTGALAVLNIEAQFWTWTAEVTSHSAGSSVFTYRSDNLNGIRSHLNYNDDSYYLVGKLEALDAPGEWYHDPDSSQLYLYRPGGGAPQPGEISVKRLEYGLSGSSFNNVSISGLDFFGCTFRFTSCSNLLIEKCNIVYPSFSRTVPERTKGAGSAPCSYVKGSYVTVRECRISYSSGHGLKLVGAHNLIENNEIHDVCWSGSLDYKAISSGNSGNNHTSHNTIRMNTVYNSGNSLIGFSGPRDIVELNHVYRGGRLCKDVSIIYTLLPRCEHSHIRYNWVHTVHPPHIALGIRGDDKTRRLRVYRNVVWDIGWDGIVVKGDENRIYNNTSFDCNKAGIYLETGLEPSKSWHDHIPEVIANLNSFTYNNLAELIYGHRNNPTPPSGDVKANHVESNYRGLLVNKVGYDFRPRLGAGLINAGEPVPGTNDPHSIDRPDAGAYEFGDDQYWIPGFREAGVSFPVPRDNSAVDSDVIDLMWREAYRASSYDLYFGTSESGVRKADHESPLYAGNQENNVFHPGMLKKDTTYWWRVDAVHTDTLVTGEVWEFTPLKESLPGVLRVQFMLYGASEHDTIPLEDVKVSVPSMPSYSDADGAATVFTRGTGMLSYSLSKKGYFTRTGVLGLNADTVVTDTLTAALHAYSLKLVIRDTDTGEPLEGCTILVNDQEAASDQRGEAEVGALSYGFYKLRVEKEGYEPFVPGDSVELFSDTLLNVYLSRPSFQLQVQVLDRTTGQGIHRAVVHHGDQTDLTASDGIIGIEARSGALEIAIEKNDYFTRYDTLEVTGDTSLAYSLVRTRASLDVLVQSAEGPLDHAEVLVNSLSRQTDREGRALYLSLPALETYSYRVSREGYRADSGSLVLVVDTVVNVMLDKVTSLRPPGAPIIPRVYPNPVNDRLRVEAGEECRVVITDMVGRVRREVLLHGGEGSIHVGFLEAGAYVLKVVTRRGVASLPVYKY